MCFSVTVVTGTAVVAADDLKLFSVNPETFNNDTVTYSVRLNSGINAFEGAVVTVKYDPEVLEVSAAGKGNGAELKGEFTSGEVKGATGEYAFAYMSSVHNENITKTNEIFFVEFTVVSEERPVTDVEFYCKEFASADKNISVAEGPVLITKISVSTLNIPHINNPEIVDEGVKLTWDSIEKAESYEIRRYSDDSAWETAGKTNETVFIDKNVKSGVEYRYTIKAINSFGESAYNSQYREVMFLAKPKVTAENYESGILVNWTLCDGALSYTLSKRIAGEEKWEELALYEDGETSYTDKNVDSGVKYEYDVNAFCAPFRTAQAKTGVQVCYVEYPKIKTIVNEPDGIVITWRESENALRYDIYRKGIDEDEKFKKIGSAESLTYTDKTVETGAKYYYAIKAVTENGESGFAYNSTVFTRVPATNIAVTERTADGIYVEWYGVEEATGYKLYRKIPTATVWQEVELFDENGKKVQVLDEKHNTYVDETVETDKTYVYSVSVFIGDSESPKSSASENIYFIKAPDCVLTNEDDGILIRWNKSSESAVYEIYKTDNDGIETRLVTDYASESYRDKDVEIGKSYSYSIRAISDKGNSLKSEKATIYRLGKPTNVKAQVVSDGIKITWNSLDGCTGYRVYRSTGVLAGTVEGAQTTSFTDVTVNNNTKYQYYVVGIAGDTESNKSALTTSISYLKAPEKFTVEPASGGLTVSWSKLDGASKYRLYYKNETSSSWKSTDLTSVSKTFTDLTAGETYEFKVCAVNGASVLGSETDVKQYVYLKATTLKLANSVKGVKITYSKVDGASEYKILRKASGESSWKTLDTVSSLTFYDTKPTSGKTYTYRVAAYSGNSRSVYVSDSIKHLAAPEVSSASTVDSGISVKWNKITGASGYYLYRKTSSGSWSNIAKTSSTSYTDKTAKNGVKYEYTVCSYSGSTKSSKYSDGLKAARISSPEVTLKNISTGVKVSWEKVSAADSYIIYRKTSGSSSWTTLKTVSSSTTSYVDEKAKNNATYQYAVRGVYEDCKGLFKSAGKHCYIAAPEGLKLSNVTSGIKISWDSVSSAKGYYIYRKTPSGSYKKIATVTDKTSYIDKSVKSGTAYIYMVRCYNSSATSGNFAGKQKRWLSTPQVEAKKSTKCIKVTWNAVTGAESYNVYRKVSGSSEWKCVKTVSKSVKSYTDKNVSKGKTYTYKVQAVKSPYKSATKSSNSVKYK